MKRADVVDAARAVVREAVDALDTMLAATRDEATSEASRAENKYDTRALEASYLAAGQGRRMLELRQLLGWLDQLDPQPSPTSPVGQGALVQLESAERTRWLLLAPSGGPEVEVDGEVVSLVSVRAPLGKALLGLEVDDEVAFRDQTYEVVARH